MAWTYHTTALGSSTKPHHSRYMVRLTIGDTDASALRVLEDEEIDALVLQGGSIIGASVSASRALAAKYARVPVSKDVGDLKLVRAEYDRLMNLSSQLQRDSAAYAAPIVGGVSRSDKLSRERDPDRTVPAFSRGMDDYPGTGRDDRNGNSTLLGSY